LRAAHRISGDVSMWPVMADCERGMNRPLKALNLAGSDEVKRLAKPEEIDPKTPQPPLSDFKKII
jgi:hypothetical protein